MYEANRILKFKRTPTQLFAAVRGRDHSRYNKPRTVDNEQQLCKQQERARAGTRSPAVHSERCVGVIISPTTNNGCDARSTYEQMYGCAAGVCCRPIPPNTELVVDVAFASYAAVYTILIRMYAQSNSGAQELGSQGITLSCAWYVLHLLSSYRRTMGGVWFCEHGLDHHSNNVLKEPTLDAWLVPVVSSDFARAAVFDSRRDRGRPWRVKSTSQFS